MRDLPLTLLTLIGLFIASPAAAQNPIKSNPDVYHLVFENATVRVLHVTVKPGAKTTMHEHPENVIVALSDSRVKFAGADGTSVEAALKADQAMLAPAEKQAGENLENTPAECGQNALVGRSFDGGRSLGEVPLNLGIIHRPAAVGTALRALHRGDQLADGVRQGLAVIRNRDQNRDPRASSV